MENFLIDSIYDRRAVASSRYLSSTKIFLMDFFILNCSFFICYYFKQDTVELSWKYSRLLLIFYCCWIIASISVKKFDTSSYSGYGSAIFTFFKSSLYLTYFISSVVVLAGFSSYSRGHVFSTCIMVFVLECALWSLYSSMVYSRATDRVSVGNILNQFRVDKNISYSLLLIDILLIFFSFFAVNYLKRGTFKLPPDYGDLLMVFVGLWFVVSVATNKFSVNKFSNIYFLIWQWIKAGGLMLVLMSAMIFGFRLFYFSRTQAIGPIILMLMQELVFILLYCRIVRNRGMELDIESVDKVRSMINQEDIPLNVNIDVIRQTFMESSREKFQRALSFQNRELLEFIESHLDLDDMLRVETAIERSCELPDPYSDRVLLRLFLNQWKLNDVRRLNAYFLQVHRMLLAGGCFIGYAHTIKTHHEWIHCRFPRYIADLVYFVDFCFNRIMPKLPALKQIYFSITEGRGRVLSRAELLGRLCFCGFEIVAEKEIRQRLYVIARKVKTSSLDQSPTYGPLIQLKRSGLDGKTVFIYKFRTMHPYSEYLQQYVYEMQGLQKGGKIEDDFRMTTWGKWMRKLWLDELPMLYNWLKGDLNIVGVRPLSFHYLSLYDQELQELRKKVKPGLIPPFYVDLPKTFEEICDSERRYINSFLQHPVKTQVVYFFKAFVNIAIRGARSN